MIKKEQMETIINTVVSGIRGRSQFFFLTAFLPHTNRRFDSLLDTGIDLQKELLTINDGAESLLEFQKRSTRWRLITPVSDLS